MELFENANKNKNLQKNLFNEIIDQQKSQYMSDNKERCDLINEIFISKYHINILSQNDSISNKEIKNLEEQIQVKDAEKIEYEEEDMKKVKEYLDYLNHFETEFLKNFNADQNLISESYIFSEQCFISLEKMSEKIEEIPKLMETIRSQGKTSLDIENQEFNSIMKMDEERNQQEMDLIAKIATAEEEANVEKQKMQEINNLIVQENELAKEVKEFNEKLIPCAIKKVDTIRVNISNLETDIEEKNKINAEVQGKIDDLMRNIQDVHVEKDSLMSASLKTKAMIDLINSMESILDVELNESLQDFAASDEYKKEKDNIANLFSDNKDIKNDFENLKKLEDERIKQYDDLDLKIKEAELTFMNLQKEIDTINSVYDTKNAELEVLNDEIAVVVESIKKDNADFMAFKSTFEGLAEEYKNQYKEVKLAEKKSKELAKKLKEDLQQNEANSQEKKNISNRPQKIHNWLENLPCRFTQTFNSNNASSSSSTDSDDSMKKNFSSDSKKNELSKHSSDIIGISNIDLDIDDPDMIEDNIDYSFSEGNSDYWMDSSFLSLEHSK